MRIRPKAQPVWRRRHWWLLALAAALLVTAAVAGALTSVPGQAAWWISGSIALLGFFGAEVLEASRRLIQSREADTQVVRRAVFEQSGAHGLRLPRVSDVELTQLGVHRSLRAVEYQRRDAEPDVRSALASGEPVLVFGRSLTGKTRMCAAIVQADYPDLPLLQPLPSRLSDLIDAGVPQGTIVWLDDVERYLSVPGLREDWIDALSRTGNVVIATIRASVLESYNPTSASRPPEARMLERFKRVYLASDVAESARIASQMPDPETASGVKTYGIGEYLGGGHLATQQYEEAKDAHPVGQAIVRAAVDLRLSGIDPVPRSALIDLWPNYATAPARGAAESPSQGLAWAEKLTWEVVQLIEPAGDGLVRASDYMVDYLSDKSRGYSFPMDGLNLAVKRIAIDLRIPPQRPAPIAQRRLAALMASERRARARGSLSYNLEMRLSHAYARVGARLFHAGDVPGAVSAWEAGLRIGCEPYSRQAGVSLAALLFRKGEIDKVRSVWRRLTIMSL